MEISPSIAILPPPLLFAIDPLTTRSSRLDLAAPKGAEQQNEPAGYLLTPFFSSQLQLVIDNFFTPRECSSLIFLATSSSAWSAASLNVGTEVLDTSQRKSSRIVLDDNDIANELYRKVQPWQFEAAARESKRGNGRWELLRPVHATMKGQEREKIERETWKLYV